VTDAAPLTVGLSDCKGEAEAYIDCLSLPLGVCRTEIDDVSEYVGLYVSKADTEALLETLLLRLAESETLGDNVPYSEAEMLLETLPLRLAESETLGDKVPYSEPEMLLETLPLRLAVEDTRGDGEPSDEADEDDIPSVIRICTPVPTLLRSLIN
jgi:hypothetical protein